MPVGAMPGVASAMVPPGIAVGVAAARVASATARSRVVSTATAEVAAGRYMPTAPRNVATASPYVPTTTAAAAVAATTTPAVLRQHRGRAHQYRPQNAGCQKKASALGTHNCRLPLPVARSRNHFETHINKT